LLEFDYLRATEFFIIALLVEKIRFDQLISNYHHLRIDECRKISRVRRHLSDQ